MKNKQAAMLLHALLRDLQLRQPAMVRLLKRFVRVESPSDDKAALDRFARLLAAEFRSRGARVRLIPAWRTGNHVRAEFEFGPSGRKSRKQILVLGHFDTVYPMGTLARMPFRIAGGRAWGPGTFDMKSGLVLALFASDALQRSRAKLSNPIVFLFTSDEEVGSRTSQEIIEREARRSDVVLVLEPAAGIDGKLKTARKGVGVVELHVCGRAAHAGLNPRNGVNAVHELAMQIERIQRFNDPRRGISVNTDVVAGGTRSNVIPEEAHAVVDVRVARMADRHVLERKFRTLRPILPGAHLEVRGGISRPPLERTAAVVALFHHATELAQEMGLRLDEASVGGGSDGNLTAALGIPTLDGLGGVGEGAHSVNENVLIRALPERAALLAALLATLGGEGKRKN